MNVVHRPRLLSDNGSSYVASDLANWLDKQNIKHVRGAPDHPQTQSKLSAGIRRSRTASCLSTTTGDLERQVAAFVADYNHARYHDSLDNLTPADVYFGRAEAVLLERERITRQTIANRRLQHHLPACRIISITDDPEPPFCRPPICLKSSDDGHLRIPAGDLSRRSGWGRRQAAIAGRWNGRRNWAEKTPRVEARSSRIRAAARSAASCSMLVVTPSPRGSVTERIEQRRMHVEA